MNFKKIAMTVAVAGVVLASAVPALAYHHSNGGSVTVSNKGNIDNTSVNVANTGLNVAAGHHSDVKTGNAAAFQNTDNEITTSSSCGCSSSKGGKTSVKNTGDISNLSVNVANSGANGSFGGDVKTGNAVAGQGVTNVVNTNVGGSN